MVIGGIKKKRVSKKLKSSWRKNVDIQDVEEFLEDQRLEERLGPSLETVTNDELFQLDTKPSTELLISAKEKRKLRAQRPLKCFSALQPHSKVPDPITKRNRVRTKNERKNSLVKKKEELNRAKGILKAKEIQAEANRRLDQKRRMNRPKKGEFKTDLWEEGTNVSFENNEWVSTNTKKHNLRGVGAAVKNTRKSVQEKNSALPAIEPPHPGMSYNPSYQDHQDLLRVVADKEMKLIKEEKHVDRCTRGMFEKVTVEKKNQNWLVEMSEGLPSTTGTNVEENQVGEEYKAVNPPVKNAKKSAQQRRKQKEQLNLEKARKALKLEKKKITDIHQIKILQKQIKNIEAKQEVLREKRLKKAELDKDKPKVLGPRKFKEPDLEFNLGQDISGNLKDIKTEGNLLADRFVSMQKRNILPTTVKQTRKKAKVKKFTKSDHKEDFWKKTVAR